MSTTTKQREVLWNGPPLIRGPLMVVPGARLPATDELAKAHPDQCLPVPDPDGTAVCISGYVAADGMHMLGDVVAADAEAVQAYPERWVAGPVRAEHQRALSVAIAYNAPAQVRLRERLHNETLREQAERTAAAADAAEAEAAEAAERAADARERASAAAKAR